MCVCESKVRNCVLRGIYVSALIKQKKNIEFEKGEKMKVHRTEAGDIEENRILLIPVGTTSVIRIKCAREM